MAFGERQHRRRIDGPLEMHAQSALRQLLHVLGGNGALHRGEGVLAGFSGGDLGDTRIAVRIGVGVQRVAEERDRQVALVVVEIGIDDALDRRREVAPSDDELVGHLLGRNPSTGRLSCERLTGCFLVAMPPRSVDAWIRGDSMMLRPSGQRAPNATTLPGDLDGAVGPGRAWRRDRQRREATPPRPLASPLVGHGTGGAEHGDHTGDTEILADRTSTYVRAPMPELDEPA